ncbi:MAG: response regulator [Gammaproteobacteria bacterium]|nr:response regulator [Gammaproteobacteria bacterium]
MDKNKSLNILICDDSLTNCMILSALVQDNFKANVSMVTDPRQVESKLKSDNISLLFLDIEMPYLTGLEVIALVRKEHSADVLPIVIISGKEGPKVRNDALSSGANDFIRKPFDPEEVILRTQNIIAAYQHAEQLAQINEKLEELVVERTQELALANEMLIESLARAGELRDDNTGYHVVRVGLYAKVIALALNLPTELVHLIAIATPLHDIGKIGISDNILLKPGLLTSDERKIMESHTYRGVHLIEGNDSAVMQVARSIIISHHEKWDGTGYPEGFVGANIPIEGRIVAVADVFDALTTVRPYKKAWTNQAAIELIVGESGKAFDPTIVELFIKNFDQIEKIQTNFSDRGSNGYEVSGQNTEQVM